MEPVNKKWLEFMREQYPKGSRIKLREMKDSSHPVPSGTMGTLDHIDDIGTFHVKLDNGSSLGLVIGEDSFSVVLPQLHDLTFYMPLTGDIFSRDEWGNLDETPTHLDGRGLSHYIEKVQDGIADYRASDPPCGIMEYYHASDAVGEKVQRAEFDVEYRDRQLWGVARCLVLGELTPEEKCALVDFISGQASDGWGEGFEQQDILLDNDDVLNIHLWNMEDWSIMDEAERFDPDFSHRLPDMCWSVNEVDGSLICIKKGEHGHFPSKWSSCDPDTNRRLADHYNQKHGITKAQEQAMSVGSMFGWDVPGADPKHYEGHEGPKMGETQTM